MIAIGISLATTTTDLQVGSLSFELKDLNHTEYSFDAAGNKSVKTFAPSLKWDLTRNPLLTEAERNERNHPPPNDTPPKINYPSTRRSGHPFPPVRSVHHQLNVPPLLPASPRHHRNQRSSRGIALPRPVVFVRDRRPRLPFAPIMPNELLGR